MARSSSGSGRRPLKAEITGSNPVRATNKDQTPRAFECGAFFIDIKQWRLRTRPTQVLAFYGQTSSNDQNIGVMV